MGCEALLCLIKPFLIALLFIFFFFVCLLKPQSWAVLSFFQPNFPPQKRAPLNHYIQNISKQVIDRCCSHCHPHPKKAAPQPSAQPKPAGLLCNPSLEWAACPHLQHLPSPFLQELLLKSLIPCSGCCLRLFWLQIPATLTRQNPAATFSSAWGSLCRYSWPLCARPAQSLWLLPLSTFAKHLLLLLGCWQAPSSGAKALLMAHSGKCLTPSNFYTAQHDTNHPEFIPGGSVLNANTLRGR